MTANKIKYSIIVPCYNEADNIPLILEKFKDVLTDGESELVLVDNGSTDHSGEVLNKLLPDFPFARTVKVEKNQGYGYGILFGLKATRGEFIGWTHADMQTDPADVLKAWNILKESQNPEKIYIKGNRKNRPLFDQFFTIGMSYFETLYLRTKLWDINAQPNIFHRSFFESWDNPPHDFSLDLYVLYTAKVKGLELVRFPVLFPERIHGESKWNTGLGAKWKFIKRTMDFSTKLKKRLA